MTNPFDATQTPADNHQAAGQNVPGASAAPVPAPYQAATHSPTQVTHTEPKSKVVAALLAWFLGSAGVHNFYLGNTKRGFVQLALLVVGVLTSFFLVGFIFLAVVGIWAFVEFIMILVGSGKFATDSHGMPLR